MPDLLRGEIWLKLLEADSVRESHPANFFQKLLKLENAAESYKIRKDVERTMHELGLWGEDEFGGNNKLYNVLMAYANVDQEIAYV